MATKIWLILFAIIGILIYIYLTRSRIKNKRVICLIDSESCNEVLESKWSNILGIRNEIIGLGYYIILIVGIFVISSGYSPIMNIIKITSTIATLYSVFLMMVQIIILKKFCSYCFLAGIINIAIFILLVR